MDTLQFFPHGFQVVRWGRSVYANIQKFIQFQLTVNVAALVINFVSAVSSGDVPLTAVQVSLIFNRTVVDLLSGLFLLFSWLGPHLTFLQLLWVNLIAACSWHGHHNKQWPMAIYINTILRSQ